MQNDDPKIPFSQRNGYQEIPPQLKIRQVSDEFRRLLEYAIVKEMEGQSSFSLHGYRYFDNGWKKLTCDFHVHFLKKSVASYDNDYDTILNRFKTIIYGSGFPKIFDFIEFLTQHDVSTAKFCSKLEEVFKDAKMAYRLINEEIIAIGTEEQGEAVERALSNTIEYGAEAARSHLVSSGVALRDGKWADSIRESIHAVESVARLFVGRKNTLAAALQKLDQKNKIHPALKKAFDALYGYSNDKDGVRHANVFQPTADVDETDALFMLGACATFVSYLLQRHQEFADESLER